MIWDKPPPQKKTQNTSTERAVETKTELVQMSRVQNTMIELRWFGPDGLP